MDTPIESFRSMGSLYPIFQDPNDLRPKFTGTKFVLRKAIMVCLPRD